MLVFSDRPQALIKTCRAWSNGKPSRVVTVRATYTGAAMVTAPWVPMANRLAQPVSAQAPAPVALKRPSFATTFQFSAVAEPEPDAAASSANVR